MKNINIGDKVLCVSIKEPYPSSNPIIGEIYIVKQHRSSMYDLHLEGKCVDTYSFLKTQRTDSFNSHDFIKIEEEMLETVKVLYSINQ